MADARSWLPLICVDPLMIAWTMFARPATVARPPSPMNNNVVTLSTRSHVALPRVSSTAAMGTSTMATRMYGAQIGNSLMRAESSDMRTTTRMIPSAAGQRGSKRRDGGGSFIISATPFDKVGARQVRVE